MRPADGMQEKMVNVKNVREYMIEFIVVQEQFSESLSSCEAILVIEELNLVLSVG